MLHGDLQLNTAHLKVILKWVAGDNEDGLPNEIRECYTDNEWLDIIEKYTQDKEIPTSSSHVYQCDTCYPQLDHIIPVLDYWTSSEGQTDTAKLHRELTQEIIQSDFDS